MGSSFHQWESDPLFSAAEVVQDSADRMESLFRLLLHDQNLVQGDDSDPRLLTSIEYHKRDLATTFETAKWQLEDFERAVNVSAMRDKTCSREDVISRHRQFIRAIREQINHVKKFLDSPSMRDSIINSKWVNNLNEQDRDGLALFLIGGNATDHSDHYDMEDSSIMSRFLDSSSTSGLKDGEIIEHGNIKSEELNFSRNMHTENFSSKEDHLALGSDRRPISPGEHGGGNWDLEADGAIPKNIFHENRAKRLYSRISFFGTWSNNLWTMCGSKVSKSYTKRFKDGEEQRRSPKYINASHSTQGKLSGSKFRTFEGLCSRFQALMVFGCVAARCRKFRSHVQVNRHTMQIIFTVVFTLIFLGILVSRMA
ncbi:Syntaxin/t-SNARE family protein [Euphorbia peplus]|nr:Syntaxin/t-SNARE family protein [Euphorbia peplus]